MELIANQFQNLLLNRHQQLKEWDENPPHTLGWTLFSMVVLEWVLARRLNLGMGWSANFIGQLIGTALTLLIIEGILVKLTDQAGHILDKKGKMKNTFTHFNLGLVPLLLILPITMMAWVGGGVPLFRVLLICLLLYKVMKNWRDSIEITYHFNRLHSTLVLGSLISLFVFLVVFVFYVSLIQSFANILSLIR